MRLSGILPVEIAAAHPVLILRARQRRASRRTGRRATAV